MQQLLEIFSTREISIIFWLTIIFLFSIIKAGKNFLQVLKSFFVFNLFSAFISLIIYSCFVVYFLKQNNLWDIGLLKDVIIWFISSAAVLFFSINTANNTIYFKNLLLDNFKAVVILEFLLNFYTFSLLTEIIIIPLISFLVILKLLAENSSKTDREHKRVVTFLNYIITSFGILIFCYTAYKTFTDHSKLTDLNNLKSFLLPILLTTLAIPYFYLLSLYINYETLFIRIRFMFNDKAIKYDAKKYILIVANLNLNKL